MSALLRTKVTPWVGAEAGVRPAPWFGFTALVILAVAVVASAARLAVPIPGTMVPVTLQDGAVLLVGMLMGPRRGAFAMACYVGLGALGAPLFSNGTGGLAWLLGPTGGYLIVYPLAALVVGYGTRAGGSTFLALAGILAAQLVIFTGGLLQIGILTGRPAAELLALAVVPFLPGVAIKSGLLMAIWTAVDGRRKSRDRRESS